MLHAFTHAECCRSTTCCSCMVPVALQVTTLMSACNFVLQAQDSPLLVATAAGAAALPTLLKCAALMGMQGQDIRTCEQLPTDLELGGEFVFHSIFACPVSREQSSASNPPKILPCGHVLCHQSILKIAKSNTRAFKCPYCPQESTPNSCRELHFPAL